MRPRSPNPSDALVPDHESHAFLVASAREGRAVDVARAKAFASIDRGCHFLLEGCASVAEYGLRIGFGTHQARDYAAAGHVIEACPGAEAMVLEGAMTISSLALIAPLLLNPRLRPVDEAGVPLGDAGILQWAALLPDVELRRAVRKRQREVEAGEPVTSETIHLTAQGALDLDRARVLESRRRKESVSKSQAVEVALREFVEHHDLLETKPGKRRLRPMPERTDGGRHPRSTPAEVKRELMKRHDDVCAIEFCEHRIWLENSHHTPLSEGGGNEVEDKDRICPVHHRLKDHGEIHWVRKPAEPGGGHYVSRTGKVLRIKPRDITETSAGGGPDAREGPEVGESGEVRESVEPILTGHAALRHHIERRYPFVRVFTDAEHRAG